MRNAIASKKEAFKTFCKTGLEEHKISNRKMRNHTKKVIAKAMKMEAEKEMEELCEKPNKIFKLVKFKKRDGKDVGGKWIRVEMEELVSVKKIDVKYGRNIRRDLRMRKMLGTTRWMLLWWRGQ